MSTPDKNFISIVPDGDLVVINGYVLREGEAVQVAEHVEARLQTIGGTRHVYLPALIPPEGTSDTLKITGGIANLHIHTPRIHGGKEDCVDINNGCRNIFVGDPETVWLPRGKHLATIKGGSRDVALIGVQVGHGSETDVDLGNHSDQSDQRTEGVAIMLRTDNDSAIVYRRLNATTPTLRPGQRFKRKHYLPGSLRAIFAAFYAFLKRIGLPLCLALMLAGCSSSSGRGARLLPWNWFAPDHATQLETSQARTIEAETAQVKAAQENVRATGQALAAEPAPSLPVQVAKELNARADASLAQAVGPITAATDRDLAAMVGRLTSENADLRAQGAADLARRDRIEAALSRELDELRAREAAVTAKLVESDRRYQEQAEKHRRVWFWIYLIVGGWVAVQILAGLARFYPGLAPIARVAGAVAAPAVQAAYNRTTAAIGRAIADAEKIGPDLAEKFRDFLDRNTDTPEQQAIRQNYSTAPRT